MNSTLMRFRCSTIEAARRVVSSLLVRDIAPGDIEVLSSEPIHDISEAISGKSHLRIIVISGAIVGACAGYALAAVTASVYPLNTGGMPIISQLPVGIVAYEAMMLLAFLSTLAGLLIEGKLLGKRTKDDTRAIADGEIHVLVRNIAEDEQKALEIMVESTRHTLTTGRRSTETHTDTE